MDLRQTFRELHKTPFILPNPWDLGSARILASMGFPALATTSAGFANALGRADGAVTRGEAIAHAALISDTTSLPVNGDLENGFGDADQGEVFCAAPTDYVADPTDCDDEDPGVNPGAQEACDEQDVDEDCDGLVDDADPNASGRSTSVHLGTLVRCWALRAWSY